MKKFYSLVAIAAFSTFSFAQTQLIYEQKFDTYTGTGGNDGNWSGSVASTAINNGLDPETGFTYSRAYKADGSVKIGTGSAQGSATTPELADLNGNAVLTFRAGAWNGGSEQTTLLLEINGGGTLSESQVTLVKGQFNTYSVNITGGTPTTQITFKGFQASNSRFFLDDVKVEINLATADYEKEAKALKNTVWTNAASFSTAGKAKVEIYNTNGQLVKSFEVTGNKSVNVSDLAAGVYVVKSTENGKTTTTKVVKK